MVVKRLENIWFSREKAGGKKIEEDKCNRLYHPPTGNVVLHLAIICRVRASLPGHPLFFFFVFLFFYFPARLFPTFTAGYLKCS